MSADLVTWLRAQLDEREKVATAAIKRVRRWPKTTLTPWERARRDGEYIGRTAALEWFAARETPEQVLEDVASKRAILDLHGQAHRCPNHLETEDDPCATARALVQPFASRAGFDPSWLD